MTPQARTGANLQSIKWQNRAVVLETLWRYQPISRKDLAERTALTAATLTNIVAELTAAGLVHEVGQGEQKLGRRPVMLTFADDGGYLLGVNLSRIELSVGVFDLRLRQQHFVSRPTALEPNQQPGAVLVELIQRAIDGSGLDPQLIVAAGISSPGPLNMQQGVLYSPPNFAEWSNLPLAGLVERAFGLPVWLDNDANANALAEHWLGAGRPFNDFIYVESHSGLGSGIILNGRLYSGSAGVAGELGHTSIDHHGPRCACGNYGCVELYSSGPAIIRSARQAFEAGASTRLTAWAGPRLERLTFDHVIHAGQQGDPLAVRVLQDAARALGQSLVNAINLFDPKAIIVGYKFSEAGELCLRPIRDVIEQQAIPQAAARLNVLVSELREPVGATGAACRALSGLLHNPTVLLRARAARRP